MISIFLKIKKNVSCILFLLFYVVLSSCANRIKYGVQNRVEPNVENLKQSFKNFNFKYSLLISDKLWNNACNFGFITNTGSSASEKKNFFSPFENYNMEKGLGEIFFQTLRWYLTDSKSIESISIQREIEMCKNEAELRINNLDIEKKKISNIQAEQGRVLEIEKEIDNIKNNRNIQSNNLIDNLNKLSLAPWKDWNDEKNILQKDLEELRSKNRKESHKGFICPKPWRYKEDKINGLKCGLFYLDCIKMGEYFKPSDQNDYKTNYDIIDNKGKSSNLVPYIMFEGIKDNVTPKIFHNKVEIDHLVQDNRYIIELPQVLHKIKTIHLDPFNSILSLTNRRIVNSSSYWKTTDRFKNFKNKSDIEKRTCKGSEDGAILCGQSFESGPKKKHEHKKEYKDVYGAKMLLKNIECPG